MSEKESKEQLVEKAVEKAVKLAYSKGIRVGSFAIAKQVIQKLDEHKRNQGVAAQKVRAFCNSVIAFIQLKENKNEENSNDAGNV